MEPFEDIGLNNSIGNEGVVFEGFEKIDNKEYTMTWAEWSIQNKKFIVKSGSSGGTANVLYTVPANTTFFLTGLTHEILSVATAGSNLGIATISISGYTGAQISGLSYAIEISTQKSHSITFNPPVKVNSGETITIYVPFLGSIVSTNATIWGWEEDKAI